ncbi:3-oxoacyl-[acyl-carrier protein] reductase [Geosmithia morbida]|uniref:3-oxoacyl-[acyl-carrier-protein] reductase n=1 Tax=Geosmithia morbida TaxID=1094350 RepID=A0A9P5D3Y4_9HYPO|nr:3-oxoacyl-[acyl-carrier protein] reductase [Geosmithia morbida]KAF4125462.1 3-oxoacyl-[acyl-carrier protein] reductase [Geosmithia morbida]
MPVRHHLQTLDNRVRGRLALVTGASGGIGEGCARALASEGCDVVIHYSTSKVGRHSSFPCHRKRAFKLGADADGERAEVVASDLRTQYPDQVFATVAANLADRGSARGLVPNVLGQPEISSKHKAISILVANAANGRRIRDVGEIGEDDWDEMMEVNSRSQFVVSKACIEGMRAQSWGRIILIGSIASRGGGINGCHYAASKGALSSMGMNLATLLAPEGITVNVVLRFATRLVLSLELTLSATCLQIQPGMMVPSGMVPTPKGSSWEEGCDMERLRAEDPGLAIATMVPVRRPGNPAEVGNAVNM